MLKKITLYLFIILFVVSVKGQDNMFDFRFKRIGEDQGLSNSWVSSIYEDDDGFIWFGTDDGLNRYDGYTCSNYFPKDENGVVFGNINIKKIIKKDKDNLFVATSLGLFVFEDGNLFPDSNIGNIFCYSAVNISENKILIASREGLLEYNSETSDLRNISKETSSKLYNHVIVEIYEDSKKNLWFISEYGHVFFKDNITKNIKNLSHLLVIDRNIKQETVTISEDRNGNIWIGIAHKGVFHYNPKEPNLVFETFYTESFIDLHIDKNNQLWLSGGFSNLLKKIDLNDNYKTVVFKNYPGYTKSVTDNIIIEIFEDSAGDIWFGSFGSGVNYLSSREKKIFVIDKGTTSNKLVNNIIKVIVEDEDHIWIGTEGGLQRWNKKDQSIKNYKKIANDPKSLSGNSIQSGFKDSNGNLWFGTWGNGLNKYNSKKDNFTRYSILKEENIVDNQSVIAIEEDADHNIWIGTPGDGLYKYDKIADKFSLYFKNLDTEKEKATRYVHTIKTVNEEELLLTTYHSLIVFNRKKNTLREFHLAESLEKTNGSIRCSFIDSKKNIWVGTNIGVYKLNMETGKFLKFDSKNFLDMLSIQSITEDDKGFMWFATNKGIYNFKNDSVTKLDKVDGLSSIQFVRNSVYKGQEGTLYFGGFNGVNYFKPEELTINTKAPKIEITSFSILQSTPNENKNYTSVSKNIYKGKTIELDHNQSSFVISFTGLNYLHSEKSMYYYKLEGYDELWVNAGTARVASYNYLEPGRYTFKVKGKNNDGIASVSSKEIIIRVNAPWYKTKTFKVLLGLLLLVLAVGFYFMRILVYKKQESKLKLEVANRTKELSQHKNTLEERVKNRTLELQMATIKAEESDRLKSAFLANMSHEIRTPMNAIHGFSSLLNETSLTAEEREEYVEIINDSCNSLLVLIDDILDISILDAQGIKLKLETLNLNDFLSEIEKMYQYLEREDLKIIGHKKEEQVEFAIETDRVRLKQVITNLINNAIKFTAKGSVEFGFSNSNTDSILFFVKDTGLGIGEADLKVIFNPFLKAGNNDTKIYRGTGIGLSISQKIVNQFNGKIWVESELGVGSTFFVSIPKHLEES